MKRGFTLIELIAVIAIIGILGTLAIPKISEMMREAKAQDVISQIKIMQTSIAKVNAMTGNYYQSTGGNTLGIASPQPLTTLIPGKTCGENPDNPPVDATIEYLGENGPELDTSCFGLKTEQGLYKALKKAKFFYSEHDHTFRLNNFRLAHIIFPFEINGVRVIRISGIKGDLAYEVMKKLNHSSQLSEKDGVIYSKPIAIAKYNINSQSGGKVDVGIETPCLQSLDTLSDKESSYNCLATGRTGITTRKDNGIYTQGEEELVKKAPKVTLYYTITLGE